jgi:oligopeptidase B
MAPAKDCETVPVSLLYRKDTKLDGSAPLLLYGYGAYGMSMPAGFSTDALSFVDRGFVYAIAHARGGKDTGYLCTEGKREKKINTFTDFIATGEFLAREGFTSWGNPIESGADYKTIASYSPYHNVQAQAYPHILALAGLTDPRITYWEPAKWVAKLRELATGDGLILLRTNMEAAHAGASGRFKRLKEVALAYAFALKIAQP